jgi:hypothetical protein
MYLVYGHHNDLYFFDERTDLRRCTACGHMLSKWEEDLTVVPIGKFRKLDIGYSYDGVVVVSNKFKVLYEQSGMTGLQFTALSHNLHAIRATEIILYDAIRRGTQFENKCDTCGQYESVVGATPAYFKPGSSVPPLGFARSDIEFATKDEKKPLLICGDDAGALLKGAKLKGLDLQKVKL